MTTFQKVTKAIQMRVDFIGNHKKKASDLKRPEAFPKKLTYFDYLIRENSTLLFLARSASVVLV